MQGKGSEWTRRYPPKSLLCSFPRSSTDDEDNQTIELMAQFGIDNVRGGSYCDVQLPEFLRLSLIHILAFAERAQTHAFALNGLGMGTWQSNVQMSTIVGCDRTAGHPPHSHLSRRSARPLLLSHHGPERPEASGLFVFLGLIVVAFLMVQGFSFG